MTAAAIDHGKQDVEKFIKGMKAKIKISIFKRTVLKTKVPCKKRISKGSFDKRKKNISVFSVNSTIHNMETL